jgi:hypothetical protein
MLHPIKTGAALALVSLAGCRSATPTQYTTAGGNQPAEKGRTYRWSFDDAATGVLPADLASMLGEWAIQAETTAPSAPNVLRQGGRFAGGDFPRVLVKDLTFTDLTLRVRCRTESGGVDQACGLVFRARDSGNYFLTRANALEANVRLYKVVDGDRDELESADLEVSSNQWHTLEAGAHGGALIVRFDGKQVIEATDGTFSSGKIGLWTKADSVTAYDDLEAVAE